MSFRDPAPQDVSTCFGPRPWPRGLFAALPRPAPAGREIGACEPRCMVRASLGQTPPRQKARSSPVRAAGRRARRRRRRPERRPAPEGRLRSRRPPALPFRRALPQRRQRGVRRGRRGAGGPRRGGGAAQPPSRTPPRLRRGRAGRAARPSRRAPRPQGARCVLSPRASELHFRPSPPALVSFRHLYYLPLPQTCAHVAPPAAPRPRGLALLSVPPAAKGCAGLALAGYESIFREKGVVPFICT